MKIANLLVEKENIEILKNIDVNFDEKKSYILLGPNGSGKSSLAKVIAGDPSFKVTGGTIFWENMDLLKLSATERNLKGIFLAHQSPPEIEGLNIFSYLRLIYAKHKREEISLKDFSQILNQYFNALSLPEEIRKRSLNENFSGGERKKLEILQMLLLEPKFMILDEVDSGVDVDSLKIILSVLEEYQKRNNPTTLFITHNLNFAKKATPHEIFVMKEGTILRSAKTSEEKTWLLNLIEEKGYESI